MSSFDDKAATWDDEAKIERARAVADAIAGAVPLEPSMRLFEYGAGTGLVAEQLASRVGPITLADPSAGMREVASEKVAAGSLPPTTRVWGTDLATDGVPEDRFELIVTVMTLHHIADLPPVLAAFAEMLTDEGRLCIVDLEAEDGSFHAGSGHDAGVGHAHDGFEPDQLAARLADAGFTTSVERSIHHVTKDGRAYPLFLAVSVKQP
jgi:ubiquinone/menaquinone biosynthesis C-methylase UbiE